MEEISNEYIQKLCKEKRLRWTNHVMTRLLQRNITVFDVETALINCHIIEKYPEAYPYPACLVIGFESHNRYIHIVCGISDTELWIITAYYPNEGEWEPNFFIRRRK